MSLNELFRKSGEPTFFTPVGAVGALVNQVVGQVTIINPPFEQVRKPKREWRKGWAKRWKLFGLYLYISNVRMKKRPMRDILYTNNLQERCKNNRRKLYERQEGKCSICGEAIDYDHAEPHHILPVGRFPELTMSIRNSMVLCHRCHKEIHMNPWKNIEMMKAKAEELGIDLKERYDLQKQFEPKKSEEE